MCSPACRPLAVWPGPGAPGPVRALFWSKTGDWYEVDTGLEAEAFLEGVPRGSSKLQLVAGPDGGFAEPGGRLGKSRTIDIDAALVCCHGGPGEDGTLQAALDLAGIRYPGPDRGRCGVGDGQVGLWRGRPPPPACPPCPGSCSGPTPTRLPSTAPSSSSLASGGSSIGIDVVEDFATAEARLSANPHLRFGAVLEPYRPDLTDLQLGVRTWPALEFSAVERPIRATAIDRHPRLPRQVRGR